MAYYSTTIKGVVPTSNPDREGSPGIITITMALRKKTTNVNSAVACNNRGARRTHTTRGVERGVLTRQQKKRLGGNRESLDTTT